MKLPQDPWMLLSFLNMKLRDYYPDLNALCDDLDLPVSELTEKMRQIDYEYRAEVNQFVPFAE